MDSHVRILGTTVSALVIALGLSACDTTTPPEPPPAADLDTSTSLGTSFVATIDGHPVPESVYRLFSLNILQTSVDDLDQQQREALLQDLISVVVIAREAEREGLMNERTIAAELELQRLQHLANRMAQRHIERNPASDSEIREFYEENLPNLASTEYRAAHIMVGTQQLARAIVDELNAGEEFQSLAEEHSMDTSELGWFSLESADPMFAEAIRQMEVGSYSQEPFQTQFGWHVVLLHETRRQDPPEMEAIRDELRAAVNRQRVVRFVEELASKAEINKVSED